MPLAANQLLALADGCIPAVLTLDLPEAWVPTIEYTVYFRGIPSPGNVLCKCVQ